MSLAIPEDCSRRRMAPAAAGDVGAAPFWYYVDNSGSQQGPFGTAHMHSWHAAGYLLPTTKVAASYYGEVPDEFWPLADLFEASELPFANGAAAATLVAPDPDFVEAARFSGELRGYIFKADDYGLGYYKDQPPPPRVTLESIKEEQRAKRVKAAAILRNDMPKFDSISSS